jgi:hypothetical protein
MNEQQHLMAQLSKRILVAAKSGEAMNVGFVAGAINQHAQNPKECSQMGLVLTFEHFHEANFLKTELRELTDLFVELVNILEEMPE